ncbi:hypothetical protein ScalyP_jg10650 [Parmales sp. scaly parma]|nr:hypothetical protein ScalyP_jg10650 [Parmales sp. scaly parma]
MASRIINATFRTAFCEDDPVDPLPALKEKCKPGCKIEWAKYEACGERIAAKGSGDCEPWYFDFLKCIDRCVAPELFKQTK